MRDTGVGTSLSGIGRSEQGKFRKAGVRVLRRGRAQRRETKISARFNLVSFRDVTEGMKKTFRVRAPKATKVPPRRSAEGMKKTFRARAPKATKDPLRRSAEGMENTFRARAPKATKVPPRQGHEKDLSSESRRPRVCLNMLKGRGPPKHKSTSARKHRVHEKKPKTMVTKASKIARGPL